MAKGCALMVLGAALFVVCLGFFGGGLGPTVFWPIGQEPRWVLTLVFVGTWAGLLLGLVGLLFAGVALADRLNPRQRR